MFITPVCWRREARYNTTRHGKRSSYFVVLCWVDGLRGNIAIKSTPSLWILSYCGLNQTLVGLYTRGLVHLMSRHLYSQTQLRLRREVQGSNARLKTAIIHTLVLSFIFNGTVTYWRMWTQPAVCHSPDSHRWNRCRRPQPSPPPRTEEPSGCWSQSLPWLWDGPLCSQRSPAATWQPGLAGLKDTLFCLYTTLNQIIFKLGTCAATLVKISGKDLTHLYR